MNPREFMVVIDSIKDSVQDIEKSLSDIVSGLVIPLKDYQTGMFELGKAKIKLWKSLFLLVSGVLIGAIGMSIIYFQGVK